MSILSGFSLKGKVALLTGGAGLYGRQIAAALAEAGATTYVAARNVKALEKVAAEERGRGYDVTALHYDQDEESSILALRDEILKRSGRIDILVNNSVSRPMHHMNDEASLFEKSMHTNATGLFIITRAFGDVMAEQGNGSIINVGSYMATVGPDGWLYEGLSINGFVPDYFFHKGGMANFTRYTASYYGPHNVRCNCINPGGFQTEDHKEEFVKRYSARTFLRRMADSTDLKGVIVFLASDTSAYITGTNIPVDGGLTAK